MTTTRSRTSRTTRPTSRPRLTVVEPQLVRLPNVRSAQKRIESGYYDREEVRDRLAVAVLQALLAD